MVHMGFMLQQFNFRRRKARDKVVFLIRISAVVLALTLIPVPMKTSAVEESKASERETESEPLDEAEKETEPESPEVIEKETEPETSKETEKETEPETSKATEKETEPETPKATEKETEPESSKKTEDEKETSAKTETESKPPGKIEKETGSEEKEEKVPREILSNFTKLFKNKIPDAVEIKVPIYNYEVVNIVAPAKYAVALNPYELAVKTGEDDFSTEQVVSRNYGILNKSSTDKIVSITFELEDLNEGKIVFVDSAEEAREADKDTYAVYLAVVPADDSGVWIHGESVDSDTTATDLSDVEMSGAMESALSLGEGENTISFKLDKAVYCFEDGRELTLDEEESGSDDSLKLSGLAPEEGGITGFTFIGAMNPKADWGKLLYGIKISAVYTYETATGEEMILEGTDAVVDTEYTDSMLEQYE